MFNYIKKLLKTDNLSVAVNEIEKIIILKEKLSGMLVDESLLDMKNTQLEILKHNFSVAANTFELYSEPDYTKKNYQSTSCEVFEINDSDVILSKGLLNSSITKVMIDPSLVCKDYRFLSLLVAAFVMMYRVERR